MQFTLIRNFTNKLYTEGSLFVTNEKGLEDLYIPYTVEYTKNLVPTGIYSLGLVIKQHVRKRQLSLLTCDGTRIPLAFFEAGHSYINSRQHGSIILGEECIPGSVTNGNVYFNRLFERIEKAEQRGEDVYLIISDHLVQSSLVHHHWIEPNNHGCGTTTIHVETTADGATHVLDGDEIIRTYAPRGAMLTC